MSWLDNSLMAKNGVAKGKQGERHSLTIDDQGAFHYVYGPYVKPVLTVSPGAVVTVETHDAFEGKIKAETDKPSEILNFPFLNPQTPARCSTSATVTPCRATASCAGWRSKFRPSSNCRST